MKNNIQIKKWKGSFGKAYTDRNSLSLTQLDSVYKKTFGISKTDLYKFFLKNFNRSIKILEVGSNIGNQLKILRKLGFKNLNGIEVNRYAIELSKITTREIDIIKGSALDIPFKDNYFDLTFTSGVLIHIAPIDIKQVIKEIYRCSRKYILGFEYYAPNYEKIDYRGYTNLLWKTDFPKLFLKNFPDLTLVKKKLLKNKNDKTVNVVYLLKKAS